MLKCQLDTIGKPEEYNIVVNAVRYQTKFSIV